MEIITALGNENFNKNLKNTEIANVVCTDIQYQEAVIEILENNSKINLLILSELLPGELDIYEFINLIKYKNPNIEIIIILEKKDEKLENFIISKGINNIYYNNKISIDEIIEKIKEIKNKINNNNNIKIIEKNKLNKKIIKNKLNKKKINNKLINKKINKIIILIKKIKINKNKIKKNKIISIIGAPKVGKTIFSIIFSLIIKNKKILLVDFDMEKNDMEIIISKKIKRQNTENICIIKWKKNIDVMILPKTYFAKKEVKNDEREIKNLEKYFSQYDYIIADVNDINNNEQILKKSQKIILLVEANLLGINDSRKILDFLINKQKNQKDNIKIIFIKQTKTSIPKQVLKKIFSDFKILGELKFSNFYNFFVNTNGKYITPKRQNEFKKILNKIN